MQNLRFIVLLISSLACGQDLGTSNRNSPGLTDMQEDFDRLVKSINEVHGGIYRFLNKSQVDAHFKLQREKLPGVRDKYEFISTISETLAGLRDGHLRLEYDGATTSELSTAKLLPLTIAIEADQTVVLFNETSGNGILKPGTELVAINGVPVKDLVTMMMAKVSGDGFIETGKLWRIERNFASYYWLFIERASSFDLEVKNGEAIQKLTVNGVSSSERTSNRSNNPVNAALLKVLPSVNRPNIQVKFHEGGIAVVSVGGFQGSDFKIEIDSVFRAIADRKAKAVILDLRGNGGGVDDYGAYLVAQFTSKTFRYFDHIHLRSINPSFTQWKSDTYAELSSGTKADPSGGYLVQASRHPGVGVQQPGKYPFAGKLVVLLNGGTFSTAADVTATLYQMNRAIFVGEESGGGFEGNTSGLNARITLPHSGLSVRISLYDYWNAVTPTARGRGTIPHHVIENRVADLVDAQLAEALKLAGIP